MMSPELRYEEGINILKTKEIACQRSAFANAHGKRNKVHTGSERRYDRSVEVWDK